MPPSIRLQVERELLHNQGEDSDRMHGWKSMKERTMSLRHLCLIVVVWCFFASPSSAQHPVCGVAPAFRGEKEETEKTKVRLEGKAQALAKLVGQASLAGEIDKERKTIYQAADKIEAARHDAFIQYMFCVVLMDDKTKDFDEKIRAIQLFKKPVSLFPQQSEIILGAAPGSGERLEALFGKPVRIWNGSLRVTDRHGDWVMPRPSVSFRSYLSDAIYAWLGEYRNEVVVRRLLFTEIPPRVAKEYEKHGVVFSKLTLKELGETKIKPFELEQYNEEQLRYFVTERFLVAGAGYHLLIYFPSGVNCKDLKRYEWFSANNKSCQPQDAPGRLIGLENHYAIDMGIPESDLFKSMWEWAYRSGFLDKTDWAHRWQ
jgi:hypothetical protein